MSKWKNTSLSEVLHFGNGKVKPKTNGNIPIYGGNGVLGYGNSSNYKDETIIIGRVGAYCGSVFYENKPIWVSDNALSAKPKEDNDSKFLYYFLKNIDLNQYAGGSSHPLITQTLLKSLEFNICIDIPYQKAIAEVLSSLDDKIDLLHRQNKTLEAMAETLFRQWFVEEADEFALLGDCIKTTSGGTPSRKMMNYYENGIYQWVKSKELNRSYLLNTEENITKEALDNSSAKLLPQNSVLIAMYGATVGQFAIIGQEATCNQAICACLPNESYPYTFIYFTVKNNEEELKNRAVGSAQQNISQVLIKSLEISIGDEKTQNFHKFADPLMQKVKANTSHIQSLTNLRDTLLPKLMSGEVRVSESRIFTD